MTGQRRFLKVSRILGLSVSSILVAGCMMLGLSSDNNRRPHTDETVSSSETGDDSFDVRSIKVGVGGGAVIREAQAGKMPDGYLVKVTLTHNPQLVRLLCVNPQAAGCQRSEKVPPIGNNPGYRRQFIVLYVKEELSELTLKVMAHEICHAVATSQGLEPDPCHNENGGKILIGKPSSDQ